MISDAWRDRWPDVEQPSPNLHDAVTVLRLLEHSLRPLSRPPVHVDLVHVATNGLGALPALAAKWEHGTPMLVTEHGVALREQYLHNRNGPYRWPVKALYWAYLRRLCALGFDEAEMIAPGNLYNRRWEAQLGADAARMRTVYNGVDPAGSCPRRARGADDLVDRAHRAAQGPRDAAAGLRARAPRGAGGEVAAVRLGTFRPRGVPGAVPGARRRTGPRRRRDLRGPSGGSRKPTPPVRWSSSPASPKAFPTP